MAQRRPKKEDQESIVDESTVDSEESTVEDDPDSEKTLYIGQCVGGPLDGKEGVSRFPKGFVLIDKPNSVAWVYDYSESTGIFTSRSPDIHDRERGKRAADESDYDVRALDRGL